MRAIVLLGLAAIYVIPHNKLVCAWEKVERFQNMSDLCMKCAMHGLEPTRNGYVTNFRCVLGIWYNH
jgi:hypothetical protein